jgi:transcriptional regulator with XRE-family HTH domain
MIRKRSSTKVTSIAQIRGARGLLGWSQTELAKAAGLSEPTIKRFETGHGAKVSEAAVAKMVAALEAAGVEFTNGARPGIRMKDWSRGDRVRLRKASERHAMTFGIAPGEVLTVQGWRMLPGDPPWGRFSLKLASGRTTEFLETSHFERVI